VTVVAADTDSAGLGEAPAKKIPAAADRDQPRIAVVQVVNYHGQVQAALMSAGYEYGEDYVWIERDSGLDTLEDFELVILPHKHAQTQDFYDHASDYISYVEAGGGLILFGEPNPPWDAPSTTITWVPYHLALSPLPTTESLYGDCSVVINSGHCVTEGYPYNADVGFPCDTVVEIGPEWTVLARGETTQTPSLMVADYGQGHVLVNLTNIGLGCSTNWPYVAERMVECTRGVSAPDTPPTCDAGGPYPGDAGSPIQFDGTGSFDTDGAIVSYAWDFGDGSTGAGPTPTHTYAEDGEYMVSLCVTDDDGLESCCQSEPVVATESHSWSAVKSLYR
jgi:hypothetical protein